MVLGMGWRHVAGAALCVLLTTSCASSAWKKDPNVTSGRWTTTPDAGASGNMLPPRNELSYSEEAAATRPATSPTTRRAAAPRKRVRPELTGVVTIGSEGSRSGSPQSRAHLDFRCGTGRGRCTVVVQVQTPVGLDNEHLELRLEKLDKSGNPVGAGGTTRQSGVLQGEAVTYELSAPCGRVRLSATPREGARGREGIQSRWTVRVLRFRCD